MYVKHLKQAIVFFFNFFRNLSPPSKTRLKIGFILAGKPGIVKWNGVDRGNMILTIDDQMKIANGIGTVRTSHKQIVERDNIENQSESPSS